MPSRRPTPPPQICSACMPMNEYIKPRHDDCQDAQHCHCQCREPLTRQEIMDLRKLLEALK